MSNIQIFIGSPRKKGNTSFLSQKFRDYLSEKLQPEINFLYDLNMQPLYEKMEQSDVLIFGTPIYWFGPSARINAIDG